MHNRPPLSRLAVVLMYCSWLLMSFASDAHAQRKSDAPAFYGPYSGTFLAGGLGIVKPLVNDDRILAATAPWTISCWLRLAEAQNGPALIAGMGDPLQEYSRFIALQQGKLAFRMAKDEVIDTPATLAPGDWRFVAAAFDGSVIRIYLDGQQVGSGTLALGRIDASVRMAPEDISWGYHFSGRIAELVISRRAVSSAEVADLRAHPPKFELLPFEDGSKSWPVQVRQMRGQVVPQDPATLPRSSAPFSTPKAVPVANHKELESVGPDRWNLAGGWKLIAAPLLKANTSAISSVRFDTKSWMAATIPGTVLTTMIDRGIYPDPDYGLNNLAIPESLNKQDYWYRTEFTAPGSLRGRKLTLTFKGINYAAEVWLNAQRLGTIKGAFIRGIFDVTSVLKPGEKNVLAVRVSPPPHPGVAHEQSLKGGAGENGGMMCLDGPTFVATEGWDWIPSVRDRNTGIWQAVTLTATRAVQIGDPQVVTSLPLPDIERADVRIFVPLHNASSAPVRGTLNASFGETRVSTVVTVPPGDTVVELTPEKFPQLQVQHPRLWWPNGYGKPELYALSLSFAGPDGLSDSKQLRFGIREITYELSLFDAAGHLRRVEYSPTTARLRNEEVVDVSHDGIRAARFAWAASILLGREASPALALLTDVQAAPFLVIKVNGVRIACKGGNWGVDDSRKRVSRERLEPYFRLHRDAHLNIIRNWVGQNTEEVFYELADEYGLLVWNDFWASTEDYNIEPEDPALFLANARDTILRFRNHPSIVMWCGRNEGVPQPIINNGLAELVRTLDGTRYYSPSSNQINLQKSGPYSYQDPVLYSTTLNLGFSVEVGIPSMPTLESFRHWIPEPDRWPISDAWAYHDWHQAGNGDITPFETRMEAQFGAGTSLEDFERKAQMMNYTEHRDIFEGFNAHLWMPNSGRLLWMSQPAWPSTMWQILSSDYDTQASFYGVKKACEPVHVQLDLADYSVVVANETREPLAGVSVRARVFSTKNELLLEREARQNVGADTVAQAFPLQLNPLLMSRVVFVKLELRSPAGDLLSENFYWLADADESYRQLNRLSPAQLSASATSSAAAGSVIVRVHIQNPGQVAALQSKLTLVHAADNSRVLPAYYTDNYISLLPGEARDIDIEVPARDATGGLRVNLRGWNVAPASIAVTAH